MMNWVGQQKTGERSTPASPDPLYIGVDVGGSTIKALLVDSEGRQLSQAQGLTDAASPERLITAIEKQVLETLDSAGRTMAEVSALGIGVPGRVDPLAGEVANAVNLHLEEPYPLGKELAARWNRPVFIENDARVAVLGAYRLISVQEQVQNMAFVNIGTGISAGLVLNGRLYRGANGLAGEIGHMIFDSQGEICACGLRGCLETVASGAAINRLAAGAFPQGVNGRPPTAETVYSLARQGEDQAIEIVQQVSAYFSRALQWLFMAYDVQKVVLGGGVTRAGHAFLDPILVELSRLRGQSALAAYMLGEDKISMLPAGYNPGTWGAVSLARM